MVGMLFFVLGILLLVCYGDCWGMCCMMIVVSVLIIGFGVLFVLLF